MSPSGYNPGELAAFDRAYAETNEYLDALIRTYLMAVTKSNGNHREEILVSFAAFIERESNLTSLSQICTAAVERLARE